MKKILLMSLAALVMCSLQLYGESKVAYAYKVSRFPFYVYQDATSKINNYVVTGWTGDYRSLKIDSTWKESEADENTSIRISYIPKMDSKAGFAGLSFQANPENYWGSLRGGYDLTKAKRLFLFARGERGGEKIEIGIRRHNKNEMSRSAGRINLTKDWKLYELDLTGLTFEDTAGGFYVILHSAVYSEVVYMDEIYYSQDTQPAFSVLPKRAGKSKS
jgi:hypothetical protein